MPRYYDSVEHGQEWVPVDDDFPTVSEMNDIVEMADVEENGANIVAAMEAEDAEGQFGGAYNINERVIVEPVHRTYNRHFRVYLDRYKVTIRDVEDIPFEQTMNVIVQILDYILQTVLDQVDEADRVRIRFESNTLRFPIFTPLTQKSELTVDRWMMEVEKVLNSHEEFRLDNTFNVTAEYARIPAGRCFDKIPKMLAAKLHKKRCVVRIKNSDDICMARALVVGKAYADGDKVYYQKIRTPRNEQTIKARHLVQEAGLTEREFSIADIRAFERVLPGYQIKVFSTSHMNNRIYKGPAAEKMIILLHSEGHFDFLTSLPAFFDNSQWCHHCDKGYDHRLRHRCENRCKLCLREDCERDVDHKIDCLDCSRTFLGQGCFDAHKGGAEPGSRHARKPLCGLVSRCQACGCTVSLERRADDNPHRCGESFCIACQRFDLPDQHKCWMKPRKFSDKEKEQHRDAKFLYFDFETWVDGDLKLSPNLAVVQDDDGHETIFPSAEEPLGRNITEDLCHFFFQEKHKGYYIIAHNLRAFDGYFVLNWIVRNNLKHDIIMNGGKIQQLEIHSGFNIHFRDSLNYNPQSLAKWPATFGITNTSKGTFPHRFNRPENWNSPTPLPFPTLEDFDYNSLSPSDKPAFLQWYEEEKAAKRAEYQFREEFELYCRNDVTVLRRCCQQFRSLFMDVSGGLCPFVSALTIAGLCNIFWRSRMLKEKQIGLIPKRAGNRFQSKSAVKWLEWEAQERNIEILHKGNSFSEHKVGNRFVDGFCEEKSLVFEFHGCFFHGCPKCTNPDTIHPYRHIPNHQVYADTLAKEQYLREQGCDLIVQWECQFRRDCQTDPNLKEFVANFTRFEPLKPRDAFYGGRTNAIKLHHKCQEGEKIRYLDVTSEYPFVNKYKRYPTGHHVQVTRNFQPVREYFGLMQCDVLPPRSLNLPVLPCRFSKKLTFALCRTCAEKQQTEPCLHTDEERTLTGTWCTPELVHALDRGYQVVKIYEVWHFPQSQVGLFADYVNKFLKIKTEASGWPASCDTEDRKKEFLQEFEQKEGVKLDQNKIALNPGLRSLAKLCLNSFWGRFGMKEDRTNTMYTSDVSQFHEMLLSGKHCVTSWDLFNDETIQLQYKSEEGFEQQNPTVNCVIAAFTTCWARLHLLGFMEQIENASPDRLLYHDTDSVIFISRPGVPDPPTGNFLGDLTDELKPGQYIREFVSLGPKTYAYQTNDGKTSVKVKGFTLNGTASEIIHFDSMLEMLNSRSVVSVPYHNTLVRRKRTLELEQIPLMNKRCRLTFDKRIITDAEFNTRPYGFCA